MNRAFKNIPFLTITGISIGAISLYSDIGSDSYVWFQRSGSLLVLIAALLGYRSIFRLGLKGVGGAPSNGVRIGKLKETYYDNGRQMARMEMSQEDIECDYQLAMDKLAGYIGVIFAVFGTVVWGYGDLLAKI